MLKNNFLRIENEKSLVKDNISGAILDIDKDSYNRYINSKKLRREQQKKIETLENRINNLESILEKILNQNGNYN